MLPAATTSASARTASPYSCSVRSTMDTRTPAVPADVPGCRAGKLLHWSTTGQRAPEAPGHLRTPVRVDTGACATRGTCRQTDGRRQPDTGAEPYPHAHRRLKESAGKKRSRPRRAFTAESRAVVVELFRRGDRTVGHVAKDFDLTETAVRAGVEQAVIDAGGRSDGLSSDERGLAWPVAAGEPPAARAWTSSTGSSSRRRPGERVSRSSARSRPASARSSVRATSTFMNRESRRSALEAASESQPRQGSESPRLGDPAIIVMWHFASHWAHCRTGWPV